MENENKRKRRNQAKQTPLEKANSQIKGAWIAAFISAGITLIFAVMSLWVDMPINIFAILDVVLIITLAILILTLKSRVAAVIILIYYALGQLTMIVNGQNGNIGLMIAFGFAYYQGIVGTFSYHRLKKEETGKMIFPADQERKNDNEF